MMQHFGVPGLWWGVGQGQLAWLSASYRILPEKSHLAEDSGSLPLSAWAWAVPSGAAGLESLML